MKGSEASPTQGEGATTVVAIACWYATNIF